MRYTRLKSHLRDVAFTTVVPFTQSGDEILYDKLQENIERIFEAGGRTFIPCGNSGEYYSLTAEERLRIVEETVSIVRDDGVVIAGVGGSTKDTIEDIRQYEAVGADAVMIHDLDHTFVHQDGIINYYKEIAETTDLGIVLYRRGPELSIPVLKELSTEENVIGVKFAVNDVNEFSKAVREVPGDVVFTTGIAERFAPTFALEGAEGFTTGIGSFAPKVSLALQDALRVEDWERALSIRDLVRPFEELREGAGAGNKFESANNVPAIKYGLELAGLYGGPVREPIVELSEADKRRAETFYEQIVEADVSG